MALYNVTTKEEFAERVLKNPKVVLVDFWAEWCPPCRAMAPVLEAVAAKLDKTLDVVKVNTEASSDTMHLAAEYEVRSIPNMNIFKSGKVVDTVIGMVPQASLELSLEKFTT